jgi:hypothetical protein
MKNTHTITLDADLVARIKRAMHFSGELPATDEAAAINAFILNSLDGDCTMYEDDMIVDGAGSIIGDQLKVEMERLNAQRVAMLA